MKACLIDTDVFSFIFRLDSRAIGYQKLIEDRQVFISFMTLAEIRQGMAMNKWQSARVVQMEVFVQLNFGIIFPTDAIISQYAEVMALSRSKGRPMSHGDAWIASTAMEWEVPLVTHNAKDYEVLGERIQLLSSDADESNSGE